MTLPATTFTGTPYGNRVNGHTDGHSPMTRFRISSIRSESGGVTSVNYAPANCSATTQPGAPESNTLRCFPVWWTPTGSSAPVMEYFHKYVVASVIDSGQDSASEPVVTNYTYVGDAAWRYTDDQLTPEKYRTWSTWRGYSTVDVTVGAPGDTSAPQLKTRYRVFRGMDGDRATPSGGTRSVAVDGITDHDQFAGTVREEITYDGSAVVAATLSTPWRSAATATGGGKSAYHTGISGSETRTTITGGTRTTRTTTSFDSYGMPVTVDDHGDVSTTARARFAAETGLLAAPYDDVVRLDLIAVTAAEGHDELAHQQLVQDVLNRSDDDLGPIDLPPRTARIVADHPWSSADHGTPRQDA